MIRKALIFYISRYSGHYHAASAIEKGLMQISGDIQTEKINALSYMNPILSRIINKAYMEVIKKKPEFWGNIYDNPEVMEKTRKTRAALSKFNMPKARKLLNAHKPDMIFCTQAFPCGLVSDYKKDTGSKVTLVAVLTDHAPHSYWLYDEVDWYIVPSEETARALEKKGVPAEKIKTYGIPIDPKFSQENNTSLVRSQLDLSIDDPLVLIMGGSQGLGAMEDIVKAFLKDDKNRYQLLVVAGSNKKLYSRLSRLALKEEKTNVRVLPYVDNIDQLMEASDVLVTKAGGMTTAESLAKKLPTIVISPIPGHERMNANYLIENGVAIEAEDSSDIYRKINEVFTTEGLLERMKESAKNLSKPYSAIELAKFILKV